MKFFAIKFCREANPLVYDLEQNAVLYIVGNVVGAVWKVEEAVKIQPNICPLNIFE
jgi:hypothetical protein